MWPLFLAEIEATYFGNLTNLWLPAREFQGRDGEDIVIKSVILFMQVSLDNFVAGPVDKITWSLELSHAFS